MARAGVGACRAGVDLPGHAHADEARAARTPPAEAGDGGPERTAHRITAAGRRELLDLLRGAVADPGTGFDALNAAFGFLHLLERAEVVALFEMRAGALRGRLAVAQEDQPCRG
ncbi:hypothetical protein [Pseudonocardia sp. TRM90224]|uniref:hypothetical protein n=1 Tax=Pseudonocardia sp. TRM90224 TaxID=2812678 RepID=UPI001E57FF4A|nr:hypothetical protein [Pseudonocardia sp. TRM90224]